MKNGKPDQTPDQRGLGRTLFSNYLSPLLWALVLAAVLRAGVVQAYFIPSGSMEPTLLKGDHLLVGKSSYGVRLPFSERVLVPMEGPRRGDIVVFAPPQGHGDDLIKRVIGLPGETVEVRHKLVYIDGRALADPWAHLSGRANPGGDDFGPVRVPPGQYFVMGDNRDNSLDSRFWNQGRGGFVPRQDIRGRAFVILWSLDWDRWRPRWARLVRTLD